MTNFYEYRQNNSSGFFVIDNDVSRYVLIEAPSADAANRKAKGVGIYFDGCDWGQDCSCCGDRWYERSHPLDDFTAHHWQHDNKTFDDVRGYAQQIANWDNWAEDGKPSVIVYFADGTVERFYRKKGETNA